MNGSPRAGSLTELLGRLLGGARQIAFLDFPDYANAGDSAIYLGELEVFRRLGLSPIVFADVDTGPVENLRRAIGERPILVHGGGNFGDLWPRHQVHREDVARCFPRNRIIQLPQSIHFGDPARLAASAAALAAHGDFHLMVRDRTSQGLGERFAPGRTYLVADAATNLGVRPFDRERVRPWDLLLLIRTDKESAIGGDAAKALATLPAGVRATMADWAGEDTGLAQRIYDRLNKTGRHHAPAIHWLLTQATSAAAGRLARQRFARGVGLIESARVVVTDRLHAVIIAWLRGVPVFYVDNSYGKLSGYVDCWLSGEAGIVRAESLREAIDRSVVRLGAMAA